jgi:ABC-type transport system involved in multi-copper enzyme maturation permease subunit
MPSGSLLLGSLVIEEPPLQYSRFLDYLQDFCQDGGGFALMGLSVWLFVTVMRAFTPEGRAGRRTTIPFSMLFVVVLSLGLYAAGGIGIWRDVRNGMYVNMMAPFAQARWWSHCLTAGGAVALLGVFVPFFRDSLKLRFRRILALTKLSFKEAVRNRVLIGFFALLVPFLFPPQWFLPSKPEDELLNQIEWLHTFANVILLPAALLIAAFGIPTDIRNQTIHTVVTKPVEKFEIALGRFFGYLSLTSMVLVVFLAFSVAIIAVAPVDKDAREESYHARVPVYGELSFQGPRNTHYEGESVGREWEYRRYMPGGQNSPYRALWSFTELDSRLAQQKAVKCEFYLDIFRTIKGEENKGVFCTFFVYTWQAGQDEQKLNEATLAYRERTRGLSPNANPDSAKENERRDWQAINDIAGELGYYEFRGKEIADYHTQYILVPSSLFRKAAEGKPPERVINGQKMAPRLTVSVRCDSRSQFLGVAKPDLYLQAADQPFELNYAKGWFGLWLRLCVVIGIAVACSTYLNGVVTLLVAGFLVISGFLRWFLGSIVLLPFADSGTPGPTESLRKLVANEALAMPGDLSSPTQQVTQFADIVFQWFLRRMFNIIPNMERLSWEQYVAKGFNIPLEDMSLNFLFVLAYLALWAALAHYLIKWREVATW